jgi:hypothetical protein
VETVADPLVNDAVPRTVLPSRNVTVPVLVAGVTAAVNVTVWPGVEEPGETERVIVDGAFFTTRLASGEVLAPLLVSPSYDAVMSWVPTVKLETVMLAMPLLRFAVPSVVGPSLNVTVPLAVGGVTAAVRTTA